MHDSPDFNSAAMSARMWLDPPQPLSARARRIEVKALDGSFATPAPRQPVLVPSFPKRHDNRS